MSIRACLVNTYGDSDAILSITSCWRYTLCHQCNIVNLCICLLTVMRGTHQSTCAMYEHFGVRILMFSHSSSLCVHIRYTSNMAAWFCARFQRRQCTSRTKVVCVGMCSFVEKAMTSDLWHVCRWDQASPFCSRFFWSLSFPMFPAKVRM